MTGAAMTDEQVRQWIDACNHEPSRQVLRDFIRLRGEAVQCEQAVALYQVAPKGTEHWREVSKRMFDDFSDFPGYREADWKRRKLYTHPHPVVDADAAKRARAAFEAWRVYHAPSAAALYANEDAAWQAVVDALAPAFVAPRHSVLSEVAAERVRQDAKWGQQDCPSIDPLWVADGLTPADMASGRYRIPCEEVAKIRCDAYFRDGRGTYADIAIEEISEAVCAADDNARRAELVQCAAVFVAWIEAIDRRRSAPANAAGPNLTGAATDGATEAGDSVHAGGDA